VNILTKGATGFVGSALLRRLERESYRLRAAFLADEQTDRLPSTLESVVVQPLSGSTEFVAALQGVDVVVNLAARVHLMTDRTADPLAEFRKVNVAGTEQLARQSAAAGVHRLVFLSSVKVNNRPTGSLSVDASKIRKELGWRPPFTMEQGLAETTTWFLRRGYN
jgi:nucleoside-diphosphate-sugar epimerase